MEEFARIFTALRATPTDSKIPRGDPLFVTIWSDGLLVEAAVAETAGERLIPRAGQIHFISDLSEEDRTTT